MNYTVQLGSDSFEVSIDDQGELTLNGRPLQARAERVSKATYSVLLENRSFKLVASPNGNAYDLLLGSRQRTAVVASDRELLLRKYARTIAVERRLVEIRAPMPALVVRIEVQPGQQVTAGQGLIVLEAMKMENELKASHSGKVKEVHVSNGTPVEKGQLLMQLE